MVNIPKQPILLVDDEAEWLKSLCFTLDYLGGINNYILCHNSLEAMNIIENQQISLVVLDLTMPYLSGEELLRRIVSRFTQIPVIILSGINNPDTAHKCLRLGAFDYIVKTSEASDILATIQRALEQGSSRELS